MQVERETFRLFVYKIPAALASGKTAQTKTLKIKLLHMFHLWRVTEKTNILDP